MAAPDEKGKVLLCPECFAELDGGSCRDHPDDPPLDPARPEVQDMLADADAQALTSLQRKFAGFKPRFVRWTGRDYQMGEDIEEMLRESRGRPTFELSTVRPVEGA